MPRTVVETAPACGNAASGAPIVTPDPLLAQTLADASGVPCSVFQSRATANVVMSLYPLWSREVVGVSLPVDLIIEHVPLQEVLVRHWIKSDDTVLGGLLFPRKPFEMHLQEPFIQITKQGMRLTSSRRAVYRSFVDPLILSDFVVDEPGPVLEDAVAVSPALPTDASPMVQHIKVNLTLFVFRRDLKESDTLQPYTRASGWNLISYLVWCELHATLAPVVQSGFDACRRSETPIDACALLRRVMHTHFDDFGLVFGKIWWDFGLGAMITPVDLRSFMRCMLLDMFVTYYTLPVPPPIRTLFNPRTCDRGQRMCARCLSLMLGAGRMMRCPCAQVYYCDVDCQKADWGVHRMVCRNARK